MFSKASRFVLRPKHPIV